MTNEPSVSITSELISDFLSYSIAIFNRALPDVVDGLKTAQRRAIVGIRDLNLSSTGHYAKVSRLEGHVLGSYHPQGGCAGTIINMGQQSGMRYTLSDIHGNAGGSIQSGDSVGQMVSEDPPAAARYLEVRATQLCEQLYLDQLRKGIGEWRENYDGTCQEPVRFVPTLPALLLTGAQGIASGYSCYHIPYNIRDVITASTALIKNKNLTDSQIFSKISHPPEPPQGGRILKDESLKELVKTGRGSVTVYGEWGVSDKLPWGKRSTRPALIITKLANGSSERFLERVRDLADADKLPGLLDAADHSSRDGIRIVLVMKKVEDRDAILSTLLYGNTGLKYVHNVNCTAVGVDGKPRTVGVKEAVMTWYEERVRYVAEVNKHEVDKLTEELDRLDAVVRILTDLDKFLKTVRSSKDKETAVTKVMRGWKLKEDVARYVIGIPVSTLIATESDKVREQHASVSQRIDTLRPLCSPGPELDTHICSQIASLRGLGGPARAVWMTENIVETPKKEKVLTERERIVAEGKSMGMSARVVNRWIADNVGTGKLHDAWADYKQEYAHRLQMTTRSGKLERKQSLEDMKTDAIEHGMPKRGKYAWNAFIETCANDRIDVIRAKLTVWLNNLPNANTGTSDTESPATRKGGERSAKTTTGKRSQRVKGKEPGTRSRKSRTGNAPARGTGRSGRRRTSGA